MVISYTDFVCTFRAGEGGDLFFLPALQLSSTPSILLTKQAKGAQTSPGSHGCIMSEGGLGPDLLAPSQGPFYQEF